MSKAILLIFYRVNNQFLVSKLKIVIWCRFYLWRWAFFWKFSYLIKLHIKNTKRSNVLIFCDLDTIIIKHRTIKRNCGGEGTRSLILNLQWCCYLCCRTLYIIVIYLLLASDFIAFAWFFLKSIVFVSVLRYAIFGQF